MSKHYTSEGLLKLVTGLQTFIGSTKTLVDTGTLDVGGTTVTDLISAAESLDDLAPTCIPWPTVCVG